MTLALDISPDNVATTDSPWARRRPGGDDSCDEKGIDRLTRWPINDHRLSAILREVAL
jgi:hypothetical protein